MKDMLRRNDCFIVTSQCFQSNESNGIEDSWTYQIYHMLLTDCLMRFAIMSFDSENVRESIEIISLWTIAIDFFLKWYSQNTSCETHCFEWI